MAFTREQLLAEMQRRGLSAPGPQVAAPVQATVAPSYSRDQLLAEVQRRGLQQPVAEVPTQPLPADVPYMGTLDQPAPPPVERGLGEQAMGVGEAGLAAVTGATGGAFGMLKGTTAGIIEAVKEGRFGTAEAADMTERAAMEEAQRYTYAPRTEAGQEYASRRVPHRHLLRSSGHGDRPLRGRQAEQGVLAGARACARVAAPLGPRTGPARQGDHERGRAPPERHRHDFEW